jgi:DNA-binding response OmpR family regulator
VEQQTHVASVLIVARDPNVGSLLGELVAFAGHRPQHDFTDGAAGESVRRARPHMVVIDASLPTANVDSCVEACDEVFARPVLTSSTASEMELLDQAHARGCIPFSLPGRPAYLRTIIEGVLKTRPKQPLLPRVRRTAIHPSFCAAIAGITRARHMMTRAQSARVEVRVARSELHTLLEDVRRNREMLRAAVRDLAMQLRRSDITEEEMIATVAESLHLCADIVGGNDAISSIEREWRSWASDAYSAA